MKLIRPAVINDAAMISSTAVESVAAYASGTTYGLGAHVRDDAGHRIYESAQAANTGHALSDAAWWFDIGPANKWAMFDTVNGTATLGATGLDVAVKPVGRIDSIALLNLDASSARVIVTDVTDGVIFDQTFMLTADSGVTDWYAWFYEPIIRKIDLVITNIQLYSAPTIEVILSAAGAPVSCGTMIVGQSKVIGDTEAGASVGIVDYSRKVADDFGNYVLVERAFSRKGSFRMLIDNGDVDDTVRMLSTYRATPILYVGSDDYGSTAIFGIYRDFNVEIAYPTISFCSLELEGLT